MTSHDICSHQCSDKHRGGVALLLFSFISIKSQVSVKQNMVDMDTGLDSDFYKIPPKEILQKRIELYDLKRGIGETVEQWLNRVQTSIVSCNLPTIIHRFLLFDRFICGLSKDETQILHSVGTWSTLKQLMAQFDDQNGGLSRNRNISVDSIELAKVYEELVYAN